MKFVEESGNENNNNNNNNIITNTNASINNNKTDIFDLLKSRKEENIKIYKNLFSEIKKQLKDNDNKIIIANFIAFIFYLISLIGCEKGEENLCVTDFIVEFILEGVIVMLNGLLISIIIFLMFL